jgi:hypothetical protein
MIASLWIVLAILYVAFVLWYYNWSGPIKEHEIEGMMGKIKRSSGAANTNIDVISDFIKNDDGKEFVMQNFICVKDGLIEHPVTGEKTAAAELLQQYSSPFTKALFLRGGHPVFVSRKVGGLIDSWGGNDDEWWHITAMMRYRSRRDLIELITNLKFDDVHIYKLTAIDKTTSFPVQLKMSLFMRPGVYVPFGLAFVGMLIQLVVF